MMPTYSLLNPDQSDVSDILTKLAAVLEARKSTPPETSYVASLYAKGLDAILKKIGEEATETVIAAKGGDRQTDRYTRQPISGSIPWCCLPSRASSPTTVLRSWIDASDCPVWRKRPPAKRRVDERLHLL